MYTLTLIANNGETISLTYETYKEALSMKTAFMLMGQYRDASIQGDNNV